ncbi:MAG: type II toxin-antitoxin system Phd/YefM family antitoxin [Gammaproteobacteria bacterium]
MQVINFSDLRKNMSSIMNECYKNHDITIITRQTEPPMVMMSLDDYNSIEETLYLMRNPHNYNRLLEAIENVRNNKLNKRQLIED